MKRVLILAYDFPPHNSIGGQRPYSWYRYFKTFDIEPIVITRHWDADINGPEDCYLASINRKCTKEETEYGTIIRTPFTPLLRDRLIKKKGKILTLIRKGLTVWQMMTEHSLTSSDSRHPIYVAAKDFLRENKVDAIIASGEPFILFTHAFRLSKKFNTPWVADYRDGWSTNYHLSESVINRWIQKNIHLPIEQKMVSSAALITTAAPAISADVNNLIEGKKIEVIYNGYFEEKFKTVRVYALKGTLLLPTLELFTHIKKLKHYWMD
jgi:glycosyltransferase involved in cell wall biosynthesis